MLVVLRMVLAHHGMEGSERRLVAKIAENYGNDFRRVWTPTIAKLACEYEIPVKMYARWSLLKPATMQKALVEFEENPKRMSVAYEKRRGNDDDSVRPLSLPYREMFTASQKGCQVAFGGLTVRRIESAVNKGGLIQTLVKQHKLYPGTKRRPILC